MQLTKQVEHSQQELLLNMEYNADYYYNLLRMYTNTAEEINSARWDFVSACNPLSVLDYGSGVGWFKAYAPSHIQVDTYDVGPYTQTGITLDRYDLICFWDVLEHIEGFEVIEDLLRTCRNVALTVPIKPDKVQLREWKHFKPREHLHYFTDNALDDFFSVYGLERIKGAYVECPPRQDVESILYKKSEVN